MSLPSISLVVAPDGQVTGRSWHNGGWQDGGHVSIAGLDGRVLRCFERWLTDRDRSWQDEEIRVFGQLLHERLISPDLASWIDRQRAEHPGQTVRLQLSFPVDSHSSRLAALPWEYLCTLDRGSTDGEFLTLIEGILLSRSVPPGRDSRQPIRTERASILPVVGDAHSWLGPVDFQPVLDEIAAIGDLPGFTMLDPVIEATATQLEVAVTDTRPDIIHYVGHGRFNKDTATGELALRSPDGDTSWVDENELANRICRADRSPSVVILHACEGGRNDYEFRFTGLAPTLVRRGVHSVIAMQYPVTNETAIEFSTTLYRSLARGAFLDEAVQDARRTMWQEHHDAKLLGVPMIYQRDAQPLLGLQPES